MSTELRQREPRVEHPAYLAWVRKQPCTVSGRAPPSDAAHLRSAAPQYGKRATGMQEKPDDWWTLPLNHELHMAQHAYGDELAWWAEQGIPDPFALAVALYKSRPSMPPPPVPKPFVSRPAKPRKQGKAIPARPFAGSRPMQSRGFPKTSRPLRGKAESIQ